MTQQPRHPPGRDRRPPSCPRTRPRSRTPLHPTHPHQPRRLPPPPRHGTQQPRRNPGPDRRPPRRP
ncbi:hypothetical protein NNW99_28125 [Streptomyces sp. CRCS-T-1]|nr:hypothetical protein NNW98_28240 [Streptomyces koelreuteriae]UUA19072.1 hypothetical protein NNW99_28125 [Streptomyces sp. CRCS-T-1]